MKKILLAALLAALCLYGAGAAAASAALTIPKQVYTQAEADMAKLPGAHAGLRVTRLSVYPWYEDGSAYSIFIEVENISEEKIAWDDDGLVALDVYGGEMARGYGLLEGTTALVQPGERMILMAGASPRRVAVYDDGGAVMGFREVEGLGDFAAYIRAAENLRIGLQISGNESKRERRRAEIQAQAYADDREIVLEMANPDQEGREYQSLGVVVSDSRGAIVDVLHVPGAYIAAGETMTIRKAMPFYVTDEMLDGAEFSVYAYTM